MTGNTTGATSNVAARKIPEKPVKRKKRGYFFLKLLVFIIVCLAVFMLFAQKGYQYVMDGAAQADPTTTTSQALQKDQQVFTVLPNSSTTDIANALLKGGYIKNIQLFKLLSKVIGFDGLYKYGKYNISKKMNEYALMIVLTGDPLKNASKDILIPEGKTIVELADSLEKQGLVNKEKFLDLCSQKYVVFQFQSELLVSKDRKYPLEGYLYPDTYKMDEGWTEDKLIQRMLNEFNLLYTDDFIKQTKELNMTTDQVITLASLIEMEALHKEDMRLISSVFHNRLNSKDQTLLQSDTTIQYARVMAGLGRTTSVLFKDLEIDSPYNTYKVAGLPPGPVCSPRKEAINAALNPEKTKYMFFFATPEGKNIYSETYNQHLNNMKKYGVSGQ